MFEQMARYSHNNDVFYVLQSPHHLRELSRFSPMIKIKHDLGIPTFIIQPAYDDSKDMPQFDASLMMTRLWDSVFIITNEDWQYDAFIRPAGAEMLMFDAQFVGYRRRNPNARMMYLSCHGAYYT